MMSLIVLTCPCGPIRVNCTNASEHQGAELLLKSRMCDLLYVSFTHYK